MVVRLRDPPRRPAAPPIHSACTTSMPAAGKQQHKGRVLLPSTWQRVALPGRLAPYGRGVGNLARPADNGAVKAGSAWDVALTRRDTTVGLALHKQGVSLLPRRPAQALQWRLASRVRRHGDAMHANISREPGRNGGPKRKGRKKKQAVRLVGPTAAKQTRRGERHEPPCSHGHDLIRKKRATAKMSSGTVLYIFISQSNLNLFWQLEPASGSGPPLGLPPTRHRKYGSQRQPGTHTGRACTGVHSSAARETMIGWQPSCATGHRGKAQTAPSDVAGSRRPPATARAPGPRRAAGAARWPRGADGATISRGSDPMLRPAATRCDPTRPRPGRLPHHYATWFWERSVHQHLNIFKHIFKKWEVIFILLGMNFRFSGDERLSARFRTGCQQGQVLSCRPFRPPPAQS